LDDYGFELDLTVATFDWWARRYSDAYDLNATATDAQLTRLAAAFPRDLGFTKDEVNYVLGRFRPGDLQSYVGAARAGRGNLPQMDARARRQLLETVIEPYLDWKHQAEVSDFHDLANAMVEAEISPYDVIVVDEAQDLSANQIRATMAHVAANGIVTFVTDTAQRIYPRGTTWAECGVDAQRSLPLNRNYRNTRQIARLASSIAEGLPIDVDGTLPDPARCQSDGPLPILLSGRFSQQVSYALEYLDNVDLGAETVGFLHLKGGGWFGDLRQRLGAAGVAYCELQGQRDWPEVGPNVGLSTFHSAKGLEFDHVFLLGLSQEHAPEGDDADDDRQITLRRLLAMGVGRARKMVIMGVKDGEALDLIGRIDPATYQAIRL
jgi:hypothetical protein